MIYTCATLGVADALAGGPMTAQELAGELGAGCALLHALHALLTKAGLGLGWSRPTLHRGALLVGERALGQRAGVDADRLYRLLRAAVQLGVFGAKPSELGVRFRNNRLSAVLREDHPNCIKDMVRSIVHCAHASTGPRNQKHLGGRVYRQGFNMLLPACTCLPCCSRTRAAHTCSSLRQTLRMLCRCAT